MSYHAPSVSEPKKPLDPVINLAEAGEALKKERSKSGYLSTFLDTKKTAAKPKGFLSQTLGNATI